MCQNLFAGRRKKLRLRSMSIRNHSIKYYATINRRKVESLKQYERLNIALRTVLGFFYTILEMYINEEPM